MKIRRKVSKGWLVFDNEDAPKSSEYKLHAALPINNFDKYSEAVFKLLKKAVEDGIIPGFKILNKGDSQTLINSIGENSTIKENPRSRLYNNPFTIYLYENFDPEKIKNLCLQIEELLIRVPGCSPEHLSIADLKLTNHISFRKENIDNRYIAIAIATAEELEILKKEATESAEYFSLLNNSQQNEKNENENNNNDFVQEFYFKNFGYYERLFNSENINDNFLAACSLLELTSKDIQAKDSKAAVNSKYKEMSRTFHPDKVSDERIKKFATEIFQFITKAKEILEKEINNPVISDKDKVLKQSPYVPQYQYELADGFVNYKDYYLHMAVSSEKVLLRKNWGLVDDEPNALLNPNQNENAVTIEVPGYEAFCLLFTTGAITQKVSPSDFGFHFFSKDCDLETEAQKELAKRMLTTPEFIRHLKTGFLYRLAKAATKQQIIDIGNDDTEVTLYYYRNYPTLINWSGSSQGPKLRKGNSEKIINTIMENISPLEQLDYSIYEHFFEYILEPNKKDNSKLFKSCIENKTILLEILISKFYSSSTYEEEREFFFGENNTLNILEKTAILQLIYGNHSFLTFLSEQSLRKLKRYIEEKSHPEEFKYPLPAWIIQEIETEIKQKNIKINISNGNDSENISVPKKYYIPAHFYIKQGFIKGNLSIIEALNKNALLWLIQEPEIHWSIHLPIINALYQIGENEQAKKYLLLVANELKLNIAGVDFLQAIECINAHSNALLEINSKWKETKVVELSETYYNALISENKQVQTSMKSQLKAFEQFGLIRQKNNIYKKYLSSNLETLLKTLPDAGNTPELITLRAKFRAEFLSLKKAASVAKVKIDELEKPDLISDFLYLIKQAIAIESKSFNLFHAKHKEVKTFGINFNDNLINILKEIFNLYQSFNAEKTFYRHLNIICGDQEPFPFNGLTEFDEEVILNHLTKFAKEEFAVYIQGNREAVAYKFNMQDIKSFDELYNLCNRVDKKESLLDLLPHAYSSLLEAEKKYSSSAESRPLDKYIAIRTHFKEKHLLLEELAIQQRLYGLIKEVHLNYKKEYRKKGWLYTDKIIIKHIELWDKAQKNYDTTYFQKDNSEKTITEKTKFLLDFLAQYLKNYSDHPSYHAFLNKLYEDPILKDYLSLLNLPKEKVTTKETAKFLLESIQSGAYLTNLTQPLLIGFTNPEAANNKQSEEIIETNPKNPVITLLKQIINNANYWGKNANFRNMPKGVYEMSCYIKTVDCNADDNFIITDILPQLKAIKNSRLEMNQFFSRVNRNEEANAFYRMIEYIDSFKNINHIKKFLENFKARQETFLENDTDQKNQVNRVSTHLSFINKI